ncbi:MAG: four helix bundle protein [Verrucomicrobia bacterium]|nr:four helix bundle protein [Verrucomicrobiota bacterium]
MDNIRSYRDLNVYKNAIAAAMKVFQQSKTFPVDERYSLTDQIRRSSRSACANLAEAWRKRRYKAAFISKLNDVEAEAAETQVWAEIAHLSGYWKEESFLEFYQAYETILAQVVKMVDQADRWLIKPRTAQ